MNLLLNSSHPRLKGTVEMLETLDGSIYLIPPSGGTDFYFPNASAADRALLYMLTGAKPASQIADELARTHAVSVDEVIESISDMADVGLLDDANAASMDISPLTRARYDRQIAWFNDCVPYGEDAGSVQYRLSSAHVGIIGLGGAGLNIAMGLVGTGVGNMTLIDGDKVELSNLHRQLLFTESDIGSRKATTAQIRLNERYSSCSIIAIDAFVDKHTNLLELLATCDIVVNAADTPVHAIGHWVSDACNAIGIPFITMSQFPPNVRIGPIFLEGTTGCLKCYESPLVGSFPYFEELVRYRELHGPTAAATAPGCMLIGALATQKISEYLTHVSDFQEILGKAWLVDLRSMEMTSELVEPIESCPICGNLAVPTLDRQ